MQGIKDLLASERGVFAVLVLLVISVLRGIGSLTEDNFVMILTTLTGALILSKTITSYAELKTGMAPVSSTTAPGTTGAP